VVNDHRPHLLQLGEGHAERVGSIAQRERSARKLAEAGTEVRVVLAANRDLTNGSAERRGLDEGAGIWTTRPGASP
jgi:hypothetical protein